MNDIRLIDVTVDNWENICCLNPGREGREFVASNAFSIAQSSFETGWVIKGIQIDKKLIGFTMYGYSEELKAYELCRFMIDEKYQGNGFGKCALQTIISQMFQSYNCDKIYLSTTPDNIKGKHIYENAGFIQTGETCGEGDDIEDMYCLSRPSII